MIRPDVDKAIADLHVFTGGVVDTSTLIYLEKTAMLAEAASFCSLLVIPHVLKEYGDRLPESVELVQAEGGVTDEVLVGIARQYETAVLSEDRRILLQARQLGLIHFNSLMLLLAMLAQDWIPLVRYQEAETALKGIARYDSAVFSFGRQIVDRLQ